MTNLSKQTAQDAEAALPPATHAFKPARKGTRQAQLVALLQRKSGASIAQISERLGWQSHTARAALTGLRKRGYAVERVRHDGKASTYLIRALETV